MQVGDPHPAREGREVLDVGRERRPEIEHGVARAGPQDAEKLLQGLAAKARRTGSLGRVPQAREQRHGWLRGARRARASAPAAAVGLRRPGGRRGDGPALRRRRLHLDAPPEAAPVLEPDAGRGQVPQHGRGLPDHDLLAGHEVPVHLAGHADRLRVDVRLDAPPLADRDAVLREVDLAFDPAEDREVLVPGHVADDGDGGPDPGLPRGAPSPMAKATARCSARQRADGGARLRACSTCLQGRPSPPGPMCAASLGGGLTPVTVIMRGRG